MAVIHEYRICDICGKRLPHDVNIWNYHIEPPSKLKIGIWKHIFNDPYDSFWSTPIDMCEECWEKAREWVRENKK